VLETAELASSREAKHLRQLIQWLGDPEVSVRTAAAEALYQLGKKGRALPVLQEALKSGNVMVRVQALGVLETMNEDAAGALAAVKELIQ
jgi:HEAT repeat protein